MKDAVYYAVYCLENGISVFSVAGFAQASWVDALYSENIFVILAMSVPEQCCGSTEAARFQRKAVRTAFNAERVAVTDKNFGAVNVDDIGTRLQRSPVAVSADGTDRQIGLRGGKIFNVVLSVAKVDYKIDFPFVFKDEIEKGRKTFVGIRYNENFDFKHHTFL